MELWKNYKAFVIIIAVSVCVSGAIWVQRMAVESKSDTVHFIIDFKEASLLAEQSEHDVSWWLKEFKKLGVESAGLAEESLVSLMEENYPVEGKLLKEIKEDADWKKDYPDEFVSLIEENSKDHFDVVIETKSPEMTSFVERAFTERFNPSKRFVYRDEAGNGYFLIDGTVSDAIYEETHKYISTEGKGFSEVSDMITSKILYLNLGMLPEKVSLIQDAGMTVTPRTIEYEGWNDNRFAADVVDHYAALGVAPKYWILAGKVIPGYDDGAGFLTNYLNTSNTVIGIVEDTTQRQNLDPDGLSEVIEGTNYNTVRVFSMWGYIQNRYGYYGYEGSEEIDNSLFRAVVERNIRVIYYKPMKKTDDSHQYITDIKAYRASFKSLTNRLAGHGIQIGEASVAAPFIIPVLAKVITAIGAGAAALILLASVFNIKKKYLWMLFGLGCLGAVCAYFVAPNIAALLTSFAASVIMPCLAALVMMKQGGECRASLEPNCGIGKLLLSGGQVLVVGVLISFFGAMLTSAPISSINYMLELDIFRGVKLAQLLPLAFYALLFLMFFGYLWGEKKSEKLTVDDMRTILFFHIPVWVILMAGVMGAAGYIYLARTGHETNVSASTVELLARNFLEEVLFARPRTKEFLVAFPAVMLFVYCMVKNYKILSFVFGTAGVIGFTSIVNTFMHIRTPLILGIVRTGYSLLFGIILGIVYVLILDLIVRLYRKRGQKRHA